MVSFIRLSNYEIKQFGEPAQSQQGYLTSTTLPTIHKALLLSIVSIGAVYDSSIELAIKLFECTGKAIRAYLNEIKHNHAENNPPVQLMQAMILYIAFGMSFGDKTTEDIVIGHMISLQALMRDAKLMKPVPGMHRDNEELLAKSLDSTSLRSAWVLWVLAEERKRTYFTFLWLSTASLSYFNSIPDVYLDEIELALPCDEALWEAETPKCWRDKISTKATPLFKDAIEMLLYHGGRQSESLQGWNLPSSGGLDFSFGERVDVRREQPRINEGGCLVLVCALNKMVWRWHLTEGTESSGGDETKFQSALQQWRRIWLSLMNNTPTHKQSRLLLSSLPLFDHTKLLLHVNITIAKDALRYRDFEATCSGFENLKIKPNTITRNSSTTPRNDIVAFWTPVSNNYHHDRNTLREAAICAAEALETAFQYSSWWTSRGDTLDLPSYSPMGMFNCVQVLSTWLCQESQWFEADMNSRNIDKSKTLDLMKLLNLFYLEHSAQFTGITKYASTTTSFNAQGALVLATSLLQLLALIFERAVAWPGKFSWSPFSLARS